MLFRSNRAAFSFSTRSHHLQTHAQMTTPLFLVAKNRAVPGDFLSTSAFFRDESPPLSPPPLCSHTPAPTPITWSLFSQDFDFVERIFVAIFTRCVPPGSFCLPSPIFRTAAVFKFPHGTAPGDSKYQIPPITLPVPAPGVSARRWECLTSLFPTVLQTALSQI